MSKLPPYDQLFNPLLRAINALGGSGSNEEIYDKVVELEKYPEEISTLLHDPEKSNQTQLGYRLAWARSYLKKYGLLENSSRGIWSLAPKANGIEKLNPQEVVRAVRAAGKADGETQPEEVVSPQWSARSFVPLDELV